MSVISQRLVRCLVVWRCVTWLGFWRFRTPRATAWRSWFRRQTKGDIFRYLWVLKKMQIFGMSMRIIRPRRKFWIMQFSWRGRFVATAFMLVVWWSRQIRWSIIFRLKWRKRVWWQLSSRWARLKSWAYWRWTFWDFRTLRLLITPWGLSEKLTRKKLTFRSCRLMIKRPMSCFSVATRLAYSSWNRREWSDICAD